MISIKGTLGEVAVAEKWLLPANMNRDVAIFKPLSKEAPRSEYVALFLMSYYGSLQSLRGGSGGVQQMLTLERLRKFLIPLFSNKFIDIVSAFYKVSQELKIKSCSKYNQAETLLLQETNLLNFVQSKEPVNIKSFKDSFGVTKRLDAEYYQKKYEQIIEKIKTQKHDTLINIVSISKSIEPGSDNYSDDGGLPFYRVSDINKFGLSKPDKELTGLFVSENKALIKKLKPKQGTIFFSKDGSVGTAYLLSKDLDGITSGAILHLQVKNTKEIVPEYLTLALNSKLVQMQAERDAGGSIILHWRKEEIDRVIVPIIDYKKQEHIAELVKESFNQKVESERLLEIAKKTVEMAVEENEEKALKFINDNITFHNNL